MTTSISKGVKIMLEIVSVGLQETDTHCVTRVELKMFAQHMLSVDVT